MKVSEDPRNWMLTQGAIRVSSVPPNRSIHRKSADRLLKEPVREEVQEVVVVVMELG
jgi:hypothetical protein